MNKIIEREFEQMIKTHRVHMVMAMPNTFDKPSKIEYMDKFYQDTVNGQIWHQRVHYKHNTNENNTDGCIESTATSIGYPLYNRYFLDYIDMVRKLCADDKKVKYFISYFNLWSYSQSKQLNKFNKMILTVIRFMLKDKRIPKEDEDAK